MEITAAMVKELREMTGAGVMNCKKALVETDGDFDKAMLNLITSVPKYQETPPYKYWDNSGDQVLCYGRDDILFVFNFHPYNSYTDYGMLVRPGEYEMILDTDDPAFGGFGLNDKTVHHFTMPAEGYVDKEWIRLYIPSRSAFVLRKVK